MSFPHEPTRSQVTVKSGPTAAPSFGRAANWAVGLAAAALATTSVGGYFYHREQLSAIAAEHMRLIVTGPSELHAGVAAEYTVSTTAISGLPLPAQIEVAVLDPDGKYLKAYKEPADERGLLQVLIPAELNLPAKATLRIVASFGDSHEEVQMPLRVKPVRYITHVTLDRFLYQPGETISYRSLTLSQSTLTATREMPVHFEILNSDGAILFNSSRDVTTERGVADGRFTLPEDLAGGQYTLVVRNPDGAFPPAMQPFVIPEYRAMTSDQAGNVAEKAPSQTVPTAPGKIEVWFYPEGGQLVAGLENRVYFVAKDSSDKPVQLSGVIIAKNPAESGRQRELAAVQTTFEGMGFFDITPQIGETYCLKVVSPKDIKDSPTLPAVSTERAVVLSVGSGVIAAEKPIEFNIRTTKNGVPLVVAAYCRGVQVGQQPLVTRTGANPVAIAVDKAVGGIVRLVAYDYSTTPPKLAAQRIVFRRPAQKLNVRVADVKPGYKPGDVVNLSLMVTNEKGEPVPAALDAAVVEQSGLAPHCHSMLALPAYVLLTSQIEMPNDLEHVCFYLSDETKDNVSAAVALDLLLGTVEIPATAKRSPLMFDNLGQIQSDYEKCLSDYQADRTQTLNTLTTTSFFGGLGLVLLVAMLGLMRIVAGMHLWVPAIGATTCCLIIGAILMDPGRLAIGRNTTVAFSSYSPSGLEPEDSPHRLPSRLQQPGTNRLVLQSAPRVTLLLKPGAKRKPAETLYWEPQLIAGPDGKAAFRFKFPDAASKFCVTINAHGDGRIGAVHAQIH